MEVQVERDLVFAAPDGSELALDIYRAPQDDAPVTIYVYGGGWRGGDKAGTRPDRRAVRQPPRRRGLPRGTGVAGPGSLGPQRCMPGGRHLRAGVSLQLLTVTEIYGRVRNVARCDR